MVQLTFYTKQSRTVVVCPPELGRRQEHSSKWVEISENTLPTLPILLQPGQALSIGVGCATPDFLKKEKETKKKKVKWEKMLKWLKKKQKEKKTEQEAVKPILVDKVVLGRLRGVMRSIRNKEPLCTDPKPLRHYTSFDRPCFCRHQIISLSTDDLPSPEKGFSLDCLLMIPSGAYGGLHLAAKGFQFPTYAEKVMWEVSSIVIMDNPQVIPAALGAEYVIIGLLWLPLKGAQGLSKLDDFAHRYTRHQRRRPASKEKNKASVQKNNQVVPASEQSGTPVVMLTREAQDDLESLSSRQKTLFGFPVKDLEEAWGSSLNKGDWFDSRSWLFRAMASATFMILAVLLFFFLLWIVAVRVFILIESFISLRSNPIGVYCSPGWLDRIFPHV